jgi:hypothetical protein
VYYPCRRVADHDLRFTIYDRVCRAGLAKDNQGAEEVFSLFRQQNEDNTFAYLQTARNGDVFFSMAGSKKYRGIWKYDQDVKSIQQVSNPPPYVEDGMPLISPDGKYVAFPRLVQGARKLFLVKMEGGRR